MNCSETQSTQATRPKRSLSLVTAMLVLTSGVAGVRYWYAQSTGPERLFQSGLSAIEANDRDAVILAAEGLRELPEYDPQMHLLNGALLLRSDQPIEAIVQFGHAKDAPETAALAHTLAGEALYKTRQYNDALKILKNALALDGGQIDAHRWLAAIYFDLGAMNDAIDHLTIVSIQAPTDPRPHRLMGLIYRDFEEYRKAIQAYRDSLQRDPGQPDWQQVTLELAECLVKQKQHDEALKTLGNCPESAQRLWLEAEAERGHGDADTALKLVRKAVEIDPNHLEALHLKATLELGANDISAAIETGEQMVAVYPQEWRPRYTLAMAYRRQGDADAAAKHLQRMEELRDLREAFTKLHAQAIRDPANIDLRYELGTVAEKLGKRPLAVDWYQMTLAMNPQHAAAKNALTRLLSDLPTAIQGEED